MVVCKCICGGSEQPLLEKFVHIGKRPGPHERHYKGHSIIGYQKLKGLKFDSLGQHQKYFDSLYSSFWYFQPRHDVERDVVDLTVSHKTDGDGSWDTISIFQYAAKGIFAVVACELLIPETVTSLLDWRAAGNLEMTKLGWFSLRNMSV